MADTTIDSLANKPLQLPVAVRWGSQWFERQAFVRRPQLNGYLVSQTSEVRARAVGVRL